MKIRTCFIDTTAWLAIVDPEDAHHEEARDYFEHLLSSNSKLVSNNIILDETIQALKQNKDSELALKFLNIIDESILTINLKMHWISRRSRKNALYQFLKSSNQKLGLNHYYIFETVNYKKIDVIFSFNSKLSYFKIPVMPHK